MLSLSKKKYIITLFLMMLFMVGCSQNTTTTITTTHTHTTTTEEEGCPICKEENYAVLEAMPKLESYTPTTFKVDTVVSTKTEVGDGVNQYKVEYSLNNGKKAMVIATEVDLTKASIVAGSPINQTTFSKYDTIIAQAEAYEKYNYGVKVLAGVNADFFGNYKAVNAFVKDSVIVKSGHNDNGGYDYTNLSHDLPASMPMLFGVSGTTAQVAPIVKNSSVKETVKSQLFYEVELRRKNITETLGSDVVLNSTKAETNKINIVCDYYMDGIAPVNSTVLKLERHDSNGTRIHGVVTEVIDVAEKTFFTQTPSEYFVIIPNSMLKTTVEVGDAISYYVNSKDNTWKYYDTILGCRQALVLDGKVASTVKLENSNGAQTTNIPRTSVGVKTDGTVVIFSVEALRYNKKLPVTNDDPYGLNLPELADFMRYYGIYNGANFDGGGSTQLITREGFNGSGDFKVVVRSSDFGTYNLNDTRSVINTLLVTTKK